MKTFEEDSSFFFPVIIMGEAQELSLESWMRDLPEQLKDIPFIYLAIPGISFYVLVYVMLCRIYLFFLVI